MRRMRKTLGVMVILALAFIQTGCTGSESDVDVGKPGETTLPAATTAVKAKASQDTVITPTPTAAVTATAKSNVNIETELKPIKDVYKDDFLVGTAISMNDLTGDRYDLLKMHFNVTTAENEMKPIVLQPEKGKFDFSEADAIMDKVLASGMQMYGHTLVLDKQTPAWMNKDTKGAPLGRKEALENMRTHIKTVMEHFGNKVISWDVVNDTMSAHPSNPQDWKKSLHPSPWLDAIGDDYVEQAFLAAREVLDAHSDWDIKLYYNDYGVDDQNKGLAVYNMVKEINENYQKKHPGKLLIDGIGMEGHFNLDTNPKKVEKTLERFISLGVEISISELDLQAISAQRKSSGSYIWETGNQGAYRWADLFGVFREHAANIKRITFWGMADGDSWMTLSSVLLFNERLQARAAYFGVTDQLMVLCKRFP
jgi:endo-1,4-beta-xylanase